MLILFLYCFIPLLVFLGLALRLYGFRLKKQAEQNRKEINKGWLEKNKCNGKALVNKNQEPEDVCAMGYGWVIFCNKCHGFCKYCRERTGMPFHHDHKCTSLCYDAGVCLRKEFCSLTMK